MLDHRIEIQQQVSTGGGNSYGQPQNTDQPLASVWATIVDGRASSTTPDGFSEIILGIRSYTFRWRQELLTVSPGNLSVIDENGTRWRVKDIDVLSSKRGRRRFMRLETERAPK